MRKAFSIVELMIVVAIIGILAALAMPFFRNQTTQAKETAARSNLRILRGAIEFYAAKHSGIAPGYPLNDPSAAPSADTFIKQTTSLDGCLRKMPANPFNNLATLSILRNTEAFPAEAAGKYGWIYQPATRVIRLDWPGQDTQGVRYYDY